MSLFNLSHVIDDTIEIEGVIYHVDMSFDNVLMFLDVVNDEKINKVERVLGGINILLGVSFLFDFPIQYKIFTELLDHFILTDDVDILTDIDGNPMPNVKQDKAYDLKHDAEYIYAAFMQAYHLDLMELQGSLHWFKFKALLNGLPENTKFKQVVDIRTRKYPTGKGTEEERKRLIELKEYYALPGVEITPEGVEE